MLKNIIFILALLFIGLTLYFTGLGNILGHWTAKILAFLFVVFVFAVAIKKVGSPTILLQDKNTGGITVKGEKENE